MAAPDPLPCLGSAHANGARLRADTDRLRELTEAGFGCLQVGEIYRVSWGSVARIKRDLGIGRSEMARFMSFVRKDEVSGCWVWTGTRKEFGYGLFNRRETAHRASIRLHTGKAPPPRMHVMHICDNPPCVNPDHLRIGTALDNTRDMIAKGRNVIARGTQLRNVVTESEVLEIRALRQRKVLAREIADRFGISANTVYHIEHRRSWAWLP